MIFPIVSFPSDTSVPVVGAPYSDKLYLSLVVSVAVSVCLRLKGFQKCRTFGTDISVVLGKLRRLVSMFPSYPPITPISVFKFSMLNFLC